MSILSLFGVNIPTSLAQLKDQLNLQIAAVESRVGVFLQQKQRLLILSQRASALSKLPQSASWSTQLLSKSQQLLTDQAQIEKDSARFVQDANNTMTQLQTDPLFVQASQGIMPTVSWDNVNKVKMMGQTVVNVGVQLKNTLDRLNTHIANVDDLEKNISQAESSSPMRAPVKSTVSGSSNKMLWALAGLAAFVLYKKGKHA